MSVPTLNYRPLGVLLRGEEMERYREFAAEREAKYAKGIDPSGVKTEKGPTRLLMLKAAAIAARFPKGSPVTHPQIREVLGAAGFAASCSNSTVSDLRRHGLFPYQLMTIRNRVFKPPSWGRQADVQQRKGAKQRWRRRSDRRNTTT